MAKRVIEINNIVPAQYWRHVKTADNRADLASRGLLTSKLINNEQWWYGPDFLGKQRGS